MFSCEFCEIYKNTFSYRTSLVAASTIWQVNLFHLVWSSLIFSPFATAINIRKTDLFHSVKETGKPWNKWECLHKMGLLTAENQKYLFYLLFFYLFYLLLKCSPAIASEYWRARIYRSSCSEVLCNNFAKFTGKYLCQNVFF